MLKEEREYALTGHLRNRSSGGSERRRKMNFFPGLMFAAVRYSLVPMRRMGTRNQEVIQDLFFN
jgi:hypothetical protein